MVITRETYYRCRALLRKKIEVKAIAAETGLTWSVIGTIADGWKPPHGWRKPVHVPVERVEYPLVGEQCPVGRCPLCGRLVHLPCVACRTVAAGVTPRPQKCQTTTLGIELRGAAKRRYEEIKKRKILQEKEDADSKDDSKKTMA